MKRALLEALLEARSLRQPVVVLTWLDGSRQELLGAAESTWSDPLIPDPLRDAAANALRSDEAIVHIQDELPVFVQPINPPLRLIIVGAVHIGQYLASMATSAGYDVTVTDPRLAFANAERFPATMLFHEWPDRALMELGIDSRTAVVTLTHDPKFDDPALTVALDSRAFYVGALGSRRTQAARRDRLLEQGCSEEALSRIHGPVGLDIGARTPAEIAVSILAEMTLRLRRAT